MSDTKMTRFNARLTEDQKELLENASRLGGYKSLTEFVLQAAQKAAREIMNEHQQILASKRDQEVFFEAILNPQPPNDELKKALEAYQNELPE